MNEQIRKEVNSGVMSKMKTKLKSGKLDNNSQAVN